MRYPFCLLLLGICGILHSEEYNFLPKADAFVKATRPDRNFGRKPILRIDAAPQKITYLRFQISGLVGIVSSVRLRVRAETASSYGYSVYLLGTSWEEKTVTYNNRPSFGNKIGSSNAFSEEAWTESFLELVPDKNGIVNVGIFTDSKIATRFYSRESAYPPQLVIETTLPVDPVIAAAGDIACDPDSPSFNNGFGTPTECHMLATSDLLLSEPNLVSVLSLGDNQYENGSVAKFQSSFDLSWGRVKSLLHPCPGNHDYLSVSAAGYYAYFGPSAGDPARGYYSFNVGSWHFIALNSNCVEVGGCGEGSPQEEWLRADLAANDSFCTVAYWHHPRFSSGPHGNDAAVDSFWNALYEANADIVLVGHDHTFERFAPQDPEGNPDFARGIRQFVVGTGGKTLYEFGTVAANSEVRSSSSYGVLMLTLNDGAYQWRFVPESGAGFIDSGSDLCR